MIAIRLNIISGICIILFFAGLLGCKSDPNHRFSETLKDTETMSQYPLEKKSTEKLAYSDSEIEIKEAAKKAYMGVLHNEKMIFDSSTKKAINLVDYRQDDFANLAMEFTVVDLDGLNPPEVVLNFVGPDIRLVLHYEDGIVHGYTFGIKGLGDIKKDGSFHWGYATYFGWSKLNFTGKTYETINIAVFEYIQSSGICKYMIKDSEVSEHTFFDFIADQDEKEEVNWYAFSDESISSDFTTVWENWGKVQRRKRKPQCSARRKNKVIRQSAFRHALSSSLPYTTQGYIVRHV